jgi:hypothetical protein
MNSIHALVTPEENGADYRLTKETTSGKKKWLPAVLVLAASALFVNASSSIFSSSAASAAVDVERSNHQRALVTQGLTYSSALTTDDDSLAPFAWGNIFSDAVTPIEKNPSASSTKYHRRATYVATTTDSSTPSRALYEAHVDVSNQFTSFGKISVSLVYFAFWVFLMFPQVVGPIGRPAIALGGGMLMVVYRYILVQTGQGPEFDAEGVIIMEVSAMKSAINIMLSRSFILS